MDQHLQIATMQAPPKADILHMDGSKAKAAAKKIIEFLLGGGGNHVMNGSGAGNWESKKQGDIFMKISAPDGTPAETLSGNSITVNETDTVQ